MVASDGGTTLFALALLLLLRDDLRIGVVGVVVALDGVFLLVVDSSEPHCSNKLAGGVALTESTRVVVVGTSSCLFFVLAMVALDGVFLVVHSGEAHRSKLDGVAYFLTEAIRDVVVVGCCVVVGWRRRFQTCFTGMNVENYDEFCGRVVEGVVLRGKEHVRRCDVAEF